MESRKCKKWRHIRWSLRSITTELAELPIGGFKRPLAAKFRPAGKNKAAVNPEWLTDYSCYSALAPSACRYGRRNFFRNTRFHHIKAPVTAEIPGTSPKSAQSNSVSALNLPK
jgi:hypothetical protein